MEVTEVIREPSDFVGDPHFGLFDLGSIARLDRRFFIHRFFSQFQSVILDDAGRPCSSLLHKRKVLSANPAHDEVIRLAVPLTRVHLRLVVVRQ